MNRQVKIALLGRSGAGKSSLINEFLGKKKAEVGTRTNTTTKAEAYEWNNITMVDLPGFDTEAYPRDTFFEDFNLDQYDGFLCVFESKISESDALIFKQIIKSGKPHIFVRSKWDSARQGKTKKSTLAKHVKADIQQQFKEELGGQSGKQGLELHFVTVYPDEGSDSGLGSLQEKLAEILPEKLGDVWVRGVKAHSLSTLKKKRKSCAVFINYAAVSAGLGNTIPIPGTGIAADISALSLVFLKIRSAFDLADLADANPIKQARYAQIAKQIVEYGTKEGIKILLKTYGKKQVIKELAKYLPIVGPIIAGSISGVIVQKAGNSYLSDCYELALADLQEKIVL